jgi:uncharacterized protein (DUF2235 family)
MKRLVILCDGTWNTPDQKDRGVLRPTNVVKLRDLVQERDGGGIAQLVHYDPGVGTGDLVDKIFGGAFGIGLAHNVREAYEFASLNYEEGDEIFLFGFSRGAYTVRRAAGMIRKCWVLPKISDPAARDSIVRQGYDVYLIREGGADSYAATEFRSQYGCRPANVRCLGVWDTVGAYGIGGVVGQLTSAFSKSRFHDRVVSAIVQNAFQAVAIDEGRRLFEPTLFEQGSAGKTGGQLVEQSWFAGAHSNVGGGYEDTGLSDAALWWMCARAEALGLCLASTWRTSVHPNALGELRDSRTGLYLLMGKAERAIGQQKNGFEKAHNRALDRMVRDPDYVPANLVTYQKSKDFSVDMSEPR